MYSIRQLFNFDKSRGRYGSPIDPANGTRGCRLFQVALVAPLSTFQEPSWSNGSHVRLEMMSTFQDGPGCGGILDVANVVTDSLGNVTPLNRQPVRLTLVPSSIFQRGESIFIIRRRKKLLNLSRAFHSTIFVSDLQVCRKIYMFIPFPQLINKKLSCEHQ